MAPSGALQTPLDGGPHPHGSESGRLKVPASPAMASVESCHHYFLCNTPRLLRIQGLEELGHLCPGCFAVNLGPCSQEQWAGSPSEEVVGQPPQVGKGGVWAPLTFSWSLDPSGSPHSFPDVFPVFLRVTPCMGHIHF